MEKQVEEVQRKLKEDVSQALRVIAEIPSSANPSMILCGNGHKACRDCATDAERRPSQVLGKSTFSPHLSGSATMTMIDVNLNHLGQPPVQVQAPPPTTEEQVEVSAVQDSSLFLKWTTRLLSLRPRRHRPPRRLTVRCRRFLGIRRSRTGADVPPAVRAGLQTKISRSAIPGPHQKADRSLQKSGEPSRNAPFEWVFHRDGSQRAPVRNDQVQQAQGVASAARFEVWPTLRAASHGKLPASSGVQQHVEALCLF